MSIRLTNIKSRIKKITRNSVLIVPAIALASGVGMFNTTTPALATPSNCSSGFLQNGGWATCNNGTGQYRVVLGCQNPFGFWENPTGPWKSVGSGASTKACPWGFGIQWVGYNVRN